jgi:hypothetical protein
MFGENVTRPSSDNKHTELGGGGGKILNLNTNTLHGNQATSPVIFSLYPFSSVQRVHSTNRPSLTVVNNINFNCFNNV